MATVCPHRHQHGRLSIHIVKKHNRSIYQKPEVASRDELMLYIELFRCCGRLHELTGEQEETK